MTTFLEDAVGEYVTSAIRSEPLLAEMWQFIRTTNPGADNPYHNNTHMQRMAGNAVMLLQFSEEYQAQTPAIQKRWTAMTLIAGLWHDYGHSGGKVDDAKNIQVAVDAVRNYLTLRVSDFADYFANMDPNRTQRLMTLFAVTCEEIFETIRVTQWPFVRDPKTVIQKCIRDADLLYTYGSDTGAVVYSLYTELKTAGKFPADASFDDFMVRQADFIDGCVFFTPKGKELHAILKDNVLQAQLAYAREGVK